MKPDRNFLSISTPGFVLEGQHIAAPEPTAGSYWSDLVHVNAPGVIIRNCTLDASFCEENAIDGNGADDLTVENCLIYAGAGPALYVKNLKRAEFREVEIREAGGHSDLYAGDYSNRRPVVETSGVLLAGVHRADGQPVRVSWANAEQPLCLRGFYHRQLFLSFARRCYVRAKYAFPSLIP